MCSGLCGVCVCAWVWYNGCANYMILCCVHVYGLIKWCINVCVQCHVGVVVMINVVHEHKHTELHGGMMMCNCACVMVHTNVVWLVWYVCEHMYVQHNNEWCVEVYDWLVWCCYAYVLSESSYWYVKCVNNVCIESRVVGVGCDVSVDCVIAWIWSCGLIECMIQPMLFGDVVGCVFVCMC